MREQLKVLYDALRPLERQVLEQTAGHFRRKPKIAIFLSVSNKASRAVVAAGLGNGFDSAWMNAHAKLKSIVPYDEDDWRWLKADLVIRIQEWKPDELVEHLANVRRNYFRQGIAFDSDFSHALLEQELNGIAAISEDKESGRIRLDENRVRNYVRKERGLPALPGDFNRRDAWFTFDTAGVFTDAADPEGAVHHLQSGEKVNGIRLAPDLRAETLRLIQDAGNYLSDQLREDGSFIYGWFPTYGKRIASYNILRHCSTLYSMLEAWEATGDDAIAAGVPRAIDYVLREALLQIDEQAASQAYVVDRANGDEIKLGAQAALILAICKYTSLTGDHRYIDDARAVANGIVGRLIDSSSGRYTHVLNARDLSLKEQFRTVYYDGEATFALLRLYAIDPDPKWLNTARHAFDHFLATDHWKHHDHWLSYCTNEITLYLPEERYFEFGLKNAFGKLRFIHDRDTAYPTFLELMMATARMVDTMRAQGKQHLLEPYDIDFLYRTIEHRAEYQRASHFYPEMTMYFSSPKTITGSFYIRHHSFRVRIDDVEHFISGYCQYGQGFSAGAEGTTIELAKEAVKGSLQPVMPSTSPTPFVLEVVADAASIPSQNAAAPRDVWTADELQRHLNGRWITPPPAGWRATDLAVNTGGITGESNTLFIAIDEKTWQAGSGNTGIYASWTDTHGLLPSIHKKCCGAIVQRPVDGLPTDFPQLLVPNSYDVIPELGRLARDQMRGKIIAVTGTVGKSTTKSMLEWAFGQRRKVTASKGNHNSRTGVSLTLARCIVDPDICVLEVAQSALWMRSGSICLMARPHVGIITEIGMSQVHRVKGLSDVAKFKSRICQGIEPGGVALLNREMAEFDLVRTEVEDYGAKPVSYGFGDDADIRVLDWQPDPSGSRVRADICGREVRYRLPVPGRAMIANSLAVLGAAAVLGEDVEAAARALEAYSPGEGVMEQRTIQLPSGPLRIIDDSHNAEILSMKAAFEVAALHPKENGARRIAVLGRVVSLRDQAPELHRSLAEPVLAAGFDKVFTHGNEMLHLHEALPEAVRAGHFVTAQDLADAVAACIASGDTVLIKGSRRASDFGKVPALLESRLVSVLGEPLKKSMPANSETRDDNILQEAATLAVDLAEERVLVRSGPIANAMQPEGFNQFILLLVCFDLIEKKKLKPEDLVSIHAEAPSVRGTKIGLRTGAIHHVHELLAGIIVSNARDAAVALARHLFGTTQEALREMREVARKIGLRSTSLTSVTGRSRPGQKTTLEDIALAAGSLFTRYPACRRWLAISSLAVNGKAYRSESNLITSGTAAFGFFFGHQARHGFVLVRAANRDVLLCVTGARDAFHRDYLLRGMLEKLHEQTPARAASLPTRHREIKLDATRNAVRINLIGDTYFGEWYTQRRQRRGVKDALTRHGYDHSFGALKPLLDAGDLNIANFEAVLTTMPSPPPMMAGKPYILAGLPQESTDALKRAGIHAVSLGNNHGFDYGPQGLDDTLAAFDRAGIVHFGVGGEAAEAEAPLVVHWAGRKLSFFSAYQYRKYMEDDFAFFAMPGRAGVACRSGGVSDRVRAEKAVPDPSAIIMLPHWGVDFSWRTALQQSYAQQLVAAGADLIIGHGPHMLNEIERQGGRWVVHSLGNGVFNSNGEYSRRDMPPFSLFASLLLEEHSAELRLYPVFCNNLKTFWQPRLASDSEFQDVTRILSERGMVFAPQAEGLNSAKDEFGWYFSAPASLSGHVSETSDKARALARAAGGEWI